MSQELRTRIESVFASFVHDKTELEAIVAGAPFSDALHIDSMAFLELVVRLEAECGVSIGHEHIETAFENIDSLYQHLSVLGAE